MPFLLLLVLTFSCLPVSWPRPPEWVGTIGESLIWSSQGGAAAEGEIHSAVTGDVVGSISLTWAGVVAIVIAAWSIARWTGWQLNRHPDHRETIVRRQAAFRFYHLISLLAFYGVAFYLLGWGWVIQGAHLDPKEAPALVPGFELLIVTPLLAGLLGSWICFYGAERALHDTSLQAGVRRTAEERPGVPQTPVVLVGMRQTREHSDAYWTRSAYVVFHLRQNLALVFVPVLLLIILNNLVRLMPQSEPSEQSPALSLSVEGESKHSDWDRNFNPQSLAGGLSIAAAVAVFASMPWILRLVLGLKPMPDGELRARLLDACRRLHFRFSNILIWNTRGGIVNAMVVGLLPLLRYVVLTDRLVAEMTPDEVEAVFGHEVGHIKHRHMWYYLGFLFISLPVLTQISQAAGLEKLFDWEARKDLALLPLVVVLGTYIFVVFGFLSRRCERQADIYGCRTVSCGRRNCCGHESDAELLPHARGLCRTGIHIFVNALEKVAYLNGISRDRPGWLQSWQHSTIARRVDFLQHVMDDPGLEPRFQRRVGLVKWILLVGLVSTMVLIGTTMGWSNFLAF
jgi:STE24 endopeptidase